MTKFFSICTLSILSALILCSLGGCGGGTANDDPDQAEACQSTAHTAGVVGPVKCAAQGD